MSRIAIDIRILTHRHITGAGFALLESLNILLSNASPAREYVLFATGSEDALAQLPELPHNPHVILVKKIIPQQAVLLYTLTSSSALDTLLGVSCDAWWFPHWTRIATHKPFALTLHDLSFLHTPHLYPYKDRLLMHLAKVKTAALRAHACIAVSPNIAHHARETLGIAPSKLHIAPLGVNHQTFGVREHPSDRSYRASYDLNRPYLLFLGTQEPRKNILGILESYQYTRKHHALPPLVLAGMLRSSLPKSLCENVYILNYVPTKHRAALMRGAHALLFPSLSEGFGLPALEALACGTPVVCSTATPPASLFHEGIFTCDPYNILSISDALMRALAHPRDEYSREQYHAQTVPYTWSAHAQILERIFQKLS